MADTVQTLIDEVIEEGQFDATADQALRWLNRRHRQMVAGARSYRRLVTVGSTVAGTANYAAPAGLLEVYDLTVGGVPRAKTRRADASAASRSRLTYSGDGFFAEDASSAGVEGITLIPAPTAAADTIEVFAATMPDDLVATDAATALKVDADCYDALVAGAISTGLLRLEQRADLAGPHEEIFNAGVERLRRRVARRLRGAGPAQIRILGVNA